MSFLKALPEVPPMEGQKKKKHNIQGDIKTLFGKNCKVEMIMKIENVII